MDAMDQKSLDQRLLALDGTAQLKRIGANGILGVSMAVCRASAAACRMPLYARIAELCGNAAVQLPLPMVNILSGGLHAGRGMDVQDFLAIPARAGDMAEAIHVMSRVRASAADEAAERGLPTLLADEGGLSPGLESARQALDMMIAAIERAGLRPGDDVLIAIDVAATALHAADGRYHLAREGRDLDSAQMIAMMTDWVDHYPVVSIEDGLDEEDWSGWQDMTRRLRDRLQIVGDDLFATNRGRIENGMARKVANGVLVKVNQNGTVSGTLDVIALARAHGYAPIVSARSGETEDPFSADLAVGSSAGQIKIGSLRTSSTVCKYNQLLRIEEHSRAPYAGTAALAGAKR